MSSLDLFSISASGLHAQRLRMDVISANLANARSTETPEGGPYRRRDVVLEAVDTRGRFRDMLRPGEVGGAAVRVSRVEEDQREPRQVFEPGHPQADDAGYVAYPNINVVSELVDMMAATRAYEANVAALQASKRALQAALEIGQG